MTNNDLATIICSFTRSLAALCIEASQVATTDLARSDRMKTFEEMRDDAERLENMCAEVIDAIQKEEESCVSIGCNEYQKHVAERDRLKFECDRLRHNYDERRKCVTALERQIIRLDDENLKLRKQR